MKKNNLTTCSEVAESANIEFKAYYKFKEVLVGKSLFSAKILRQKGSHPFFEKSLNREISMLNMVLFSESDLESFSMVIGSKGSSDTIELLIDQGFGAVEMGNETVIVQYHLESATFDLFVLTHEFSSKEVLLEELRNGKLALQTADFLNIYSPTEEEVSKKIQTDLYEKVSDFFLELLPESINNFVDYLENLTAGKNHRIITDFKALSCGLEDFYEARSRYWITLLDFFISEMTDRLQRVKDSDWVKEFPGLDTQLIIATNLLTAALELRTALVTKFSGDHILWETMEFDRGNESI